MRLVFRHKTELFYKADIDRILAVCKWRGYDLSAADAEKAWEAYSRHMGAGWIELPGSDAFLFEVLSRYLEEEP